MRLALVVPRYGEEILGGAETFARHFAEHLPVDEFEIEVLTTCAGDLQTWHNIYPAGQTHINGVAVSRFPIDHQIRDQRRYWELMVKFANRSPATIDEEYEWIENSAHSPLLYLHLFEHGPKYDYIIFIPYLFGTTYYGSALYPERSIIWPCLHDEPFARLFETRLTMEACHGLMFTTAPEMSLAQGRLGIRNPGAQVVGFGLDDFQADGARFRRQFGLDGPFILYSGRLEEMKNVLELLSFFTEYKRSKVSQLKLVLMGNGPLSLPKHPDIVPIGFQTGQAKLDAYAAATVLCQPSRLESFSIVLMEAWLAGSPALVHADCDVTREHVLRSNGGLYYSDVEEFGGALDWLLAHPTEAMSMGQHGRAYVRREYNWSTVLDNFRCALAVWRNL